MATLTGQTIASSYEQLLSLPDGGGNETNLVAITDGDGVNTFALQLATDKVKINKLGINEASPDELLHITSATAQKPTIKIENSGDVTNGGQIHFLNSTTSEGDNDISGTIRWKGMNDASEETEYATIYVQHTDVSDGTEDGQMHFRTMNAGSLGSTMTISSGNVGIGTATPSSYNDHANQLVVAGSSNAGITLVAGTSSGSKIHFADGTSGDASYRGYISYFHNDDSFAIATAGTAKMYINSSGNVGIGVVPEVTQSAYNALQIGGNTNITSYGTQGASGQVDFGHNYYFSAAGTDKYISTDEATQFRQSSWKFCL